MCKVSLKDFRIGNGEPLTIMSGPCVIESEEQCLKAAWKLKEIFAQFPAINFIFKASYDKANRSSLHSFRGPGLEEGLRILKRVKEECALPIVTDVHTPDEAAVAGSFCDLIQIPAFLCRQTDLLVAASKTGAVVSVKKGQFMAPHDMGNVVEKIRASGNNRIILVERGAMFGYNNLVSDFRSIPIMQQFGVPVCFDATHSVQLPGGLGTQSGGQREFVPLLAKAAIAAGADCLFLEAHPNPSQAKSDGASQLSFEALPPLLITLERLYAASREVASV